MFNRDLSFDNRLATTLFKRPRWFVRSVIGNDNRVYPYLNILTKAMLGGGPPTFGEYGYILLANAQRIYTRY